LVRLGTCIALELAVAAGAAGGLVLGIGRAVDRAGEYLSAREAAAATATGHTPTPIALEPLPGADLHVVPRTHAVAGTVFAIADEELLAPLAATPVKHVKVNHGGTSLSLRLEFESGARAAFKPQQIHPQSDPKREIAAYRIDRLLGIGHVPPAKPVVLAVDDLVAAVDPATRAYTAGRVAEEAIARAGVVRGELSWWIPEIRDVMIGPYRVDEKAGMQVWQSYLQAGATIPPDLRSLLAQLSTCVLFDVLIDNADRWTGNNTKGSVDQRTLYFMDNTLAFSIYTFGHEANLKPLYAIQVFPRAVVTKLRALTYEQIAAALSLGEDPTGMSPLLEPAEIRAILARRDHMMRYIDALIAELGEQAVLALP
jgi:hypothetical protein